MVNLKVYATVLRPDSGTMIWHIFALALYFAVGLSHSWVERLMVFDSHGTMTGDPGYIRGAVSRQDPAFNDYQMQHLLPPLARSAIPPSDKMCKHTQTMGNYTEEFPELQAWPGARLALQYQENGHVTLPELSPQKRNPGTVYIYGTVNPSHDDTLMSIHKVWNTAGTGGDKRGRLLAVRPFDDGQCYQINAGPISQYRQRRFRKVAADPQGADLWCQNDIRLPSDVHQRYTLYWVWDWPTEPSVSAPEGKPELYTSCMDVNIGPKQQLDALDFSEGQDLNRAGIKAQLETA